MAFQPRTRCLRDRGEGWGYSMSAIVFWGGVAGGGSARSGAHEKAERPLLFAHAGLKEDDVVAIGVARDRMGCVLLEPLCQGVLHRVVTFEPGREDGEAAWWLGLNRCLLGPATV